MLYDKPEDSCFFNRQWCLWLSMLQVDYILICSIMSQTSISAIHESAEGMDGKINCSSLDELPTCVPAQNCVGGCSVFWEFYEWNQISCMFCNRSWKWSKLSVTGNGQLIRKRLMLLCTAWAWEVIFVQEQGRKWTCSFNTKHKKGEPFSVWKSNITQVALNQNCCLWAPWQKDSER